jgi:hypothetical protein
MAYVTAKGFSAQVMRRAFFATVQTGNGKIEPIINRADLVGAKI